MREVRVESLERLEVADGEVRMLANSGDLTLVFRRAVWEKALAESSSPSEPAQRELEELMALRRLLKEHAEENSFVTVLEDVPCGGEKSGQQFDLVLRSSEMFAVTTGYLFLPVISPEHMALLGVCLEEDNTVEQAYLIGAVVEDRALAAGDENLKALSIRGRRCSSSRFELGRELWQVLSEKLGWKDVKPVAPSRGTRERNEV
jgi:hypothetical protein